MSDKVYLKYQKGGLERLEFPGNNATPDNYSPSWVWLYQTFDETRKDIDQKKATIENYTLHIILPEQETNDINDNDMISWFEKNKVQNTIIKDCKFSNDDSLSAAYADCHEVIEKAFQNNKDLIKNLKTFNTKTIKTYIIEDGIKKSLSTSTSNDEDNKDKADPENESLLKIIDKLKNPSLKQLFEIIGKSTKNIALINCPEILYAIYINLKDYHQGYGKLKAIYQDGDAKKKKELIDALDLLKDSSRVKALVNQIKSITSNDSLTVSNSDMFIKKYLGFLAITNFITENIDQLEDKDSNLSDIAFSMPIEDMLKSTDSKEASLLKGWETKEAAQGEKGGLGRNIRRPNTFSNETVESKANRKAAADNNINNIADKGYKNDIQAFFSLAKMLSNKVSLPGYPTEVKNSSFKLISLGKIKSRKDLFSAFEDLGSVSNDNTIALYTVSKDSVTMPKDWWKTDGSDIILSSKGPAFVEKSIEKYTKALTNAKDKITDLKDDGKAAAKFAKEMPKKVRDIIKNSWNDFSGESSNGQMKFSTDEERILAKAEKIASKDSKWKTAGDDGKQDIIQSKYVELDPELSDENIEKLEKESTSDEIKKIIEQKLNIKIADLAKKQPEYEEFNDKDDFELKFIAAYNKENRMFIDSTCTDKQKEIEKKSKINGKKIAEKDKRFKLGNDRDAQDRIIKFHELKYKIDTANAINLNKVKFPKIDPSIAQNIKPANESKKTFLKNKRFLTEGINSHMIISQSKLIKKIIGKAMKQTHLNEKLFFSIATSGNIPATLKAILKKNNTGVTFGGSSTMAICFKTNANSEKEVRVKLPEYQTKIASMISNNIAVSSNESPFSAANILIGDTANEESNEGTIYFIIVVDKWVD